MNERLKKLASLFKEKGIDALLVTSDPNIRYLTEFEASESWLLVGLNEVFYITDFRYILEAKKGIKTASIQQYTTSIHEKFFELTKAIHAKRIGFDQRHLSVAQYSLLKKYCPKAQQLVPTDNLVEKFREEKETREIKYIEKALDIHEQSFRYLQRIVKPGLTEREILLKLERFVREKGVVFSFNPIIASGPNAALPHAKVTERKVHHNEVVLVDWGINYHGYKSDLTRMFFLGKIPNLIRRVNDTVRQAQQRAIVSIKPGAVIADIDYQARNYLEENNLGKFFGHALGHGVGLEIHEAPRLSQKNASILKAGMVITIEPAVYIPNKFGIRIEDMVLVTKKGYKVLSDHIY